MIIFGSILKGIAMCIPKILNFIKGILVVIGIIAISAILLNPEMGLVFRNYKTMAASLQSENLSLIDKNTALQSENDELKRKLDFLETASIPSDLNIEKVTRGVRNKNPMNVVALSSKNPWLGQIGRDSQYHAVFETYEHGLRAGYLTLKGYYEKKKARTLYGITSRFCEGNALKYAKFIGKQLGGIGPHEEIDVMRHMPDIMKAIVRYENGFDIFPDKYYIPYTKP